MKNDLLPFLSAAGQQRATKDAPQKKSVKNWLSGVTPINLYVSFLYRSAAAIIIAAKVRNVLRPAGGSRQSLSDRANLNDAQPDRLHDHSVSAGVWVEEYYN
ncbi:MAG: hypothetical protein ABIK73_08545 [candidate division WOR-3 bacterium]